MNKNSLGRKIAYILAIVLLLLPLYYLGNPAGKTKGGLIAELRSRHKIGQSDLGKLDPTSESMKLATLGLRGIASTILWIRADYYKEEKYFDRFSATLNQISLLQPHFISVWQHQAHNLSYNVSPEFEDYHQRYEWVKKGMDYLVRGTKFNSRKPILQYDLGHYVGHKLGKADEKKQYRELFRKDEDFHNYFVGQGLNALQADALGPDQRPDNWLVGKLWFKEAYDLVANGAGIKKSPHLLYSYSPLWQMYHGEGIEEEGVLDERAAFAWKRAGVEWEAYGNIGLGKTSDDTTIFLLGMDEFRKTLEATREQFTAMTVEAREKAIEIRKARVPPDKMAIYNKEPGERLEREYPIYVEVIQMLLPNDREIAAQLPKSEQLKALELAKKIEAYDEVVKNTESLRNQVNYSYWQVRALAEQQTMMTEARRMMFEADRLIDVADVKGAVEKYEGAWVRWDRIFRLYPSMMTEEVGDDVLKSIDRYKKLIDIELDERFVLFEFMVFRRAYNADSLDFNVEKTLADWTARAQTLGSAEDFFNSPLGESFNLKPLAPANNDENEKKPTVEEKVPEATPQPPTKDVPAVSAVTTPDPDASIRPPTLENPDSQE